MTHRQKSCTANRYKRFLDIVLIFPIMAALIPLFIIFILGYAVSMLLIPKDRGPIFHRVFRKTCGRIFLIYKFRVSRISKTDQKKFTPALLAQIEGLMTKDEIQRFRSFPQYWNEDQGMEKTLFGKFLKKFYMDELPQFFNILKGDMTFVGPRPVALYDERNLPDADGMVTIAGQKANYNFRNELKSGITGYYQLNKDYRALEDYDRFMLEGVKLDRQYYDEIQNISGPRMLLTDLTIIVKTLSVVFRGEGI